MSTELNGIVAKLTALRDERDAARNGKKTLEDIIDKMGDEAAEARKERDALREERDAARAELATYRALMPEVQGFAVLVKHSVSGRVYDAAAALLAKLPAEDKSTAVHEAVPCECKPATAEPKLVREWRYDNGDLSLWSVYRWDGKQMWYKCEDNPVWSKTTTMIAALEEKPYRETTPQPAPAPVAGNVPLTLVGPASLAGKSIFMMADGKVVALMLEAKPC
jgi:hypothetical protein